jgi:hypothetical protein
VGDPTPVAPWSMIPSPLPVVSSLALFTFAIS